MSYRPAQPPYPTTMVDPASADPIKYPQFVYPTAFEELRSAEPFSLDELTNKYEIDTRTYAQTFVGGGAQTFLPNQSAIHLSVTGAAGDRSLLRTNTYYRYQAGRAQRVLMTAYNADTGQSNQTRRWGYFDDNDGVFFALSGTSVQVVQRSSTSGVPIDTAIAQAAWNVDPMNGAGPSGITLDITRAQVYEIAFQWLGAGDVQFFIDGFLVHVFRNPNTIAMPYMRTGQLPLSWEVINAAASTASGFTYICASIESEGGSRSKALTFGVVNSADKTLGATLIPILSIRPKLTYGASGVTNRTAVLPLLFIPNVTVAATADRALFSLLVNPVLTGAAFASVNAQSTVESDVAATALTGGTILLSVFGVGGTNGNPIDVSQLFAEDGLKLRLNALGTVADILTVAAIAINDAPPVRGSLTWKEIAR